MYHIKTTQSVAQFIGMETQLGMWSIHSDKLPCLPKTYSFSSKTKRMDPSKQKRFTKKQGLTTALETDLFSSTGLFSASHKVQKKITCLTLYNKAKDIIQVYIHNEWKSQTSHTKVFTPSTTVAGAMCLKKKRKNKLYLTSFQKFSITSSFQTFQSLSSMNG